MEKELALHVILVSIRASTSLGNLLPLIKKHSATEEYQILSSKIAGICADIGLEIVNECYSKYPELETQIEASIEKYGIVL